ncbi:hypothetical protein RRG08_011070 [Elysia crispata]|uniref:Uncharacterized protein n=1 Tax=Elysia crispata TaxID=231223 RepID=A0AAE1DD31_9GAST|nr:hypothetical protein RRG08_011070 [Elysia crispata]
MYNTARGAFMTTITEGALFNFPSGNASVCPLHLSGRVIETSKTGPVQLDAHVIDAFAVALPLTEQVSSPFLPGSYSRLLVIPI